jgi:hypothetical protein
MLYAWGLDWGVFLQTSEFILQFARLSVDRRDARSAGMTGQKNTGRITYFTTLIFCKASCY